MAIKLIDPTAAVNGNGDSIATPYNTWGSGAWWVPGNIYLQKEGTTYVGTVAVNNTITIDQANPVVLGTYDAATGAQIKDNTRHAKIRPTSGHGINLGTRAWVTVDNLDTAGGDRTQSANDGIAGTSAAGNTAHNLTIIRCIADGRYGIGLSGANDYVGYCTIYGRADGLSSNGTDFVAEHNTIIANDIDTATYDGITHIDSGLSATRVLIRHNTVVDYAGSVKQGIYLNSNETPSGIVEVSDNTIFGFTQCIVSLTPGARILRNRITKPIRTGPGGDAEGAITISAANCIVSDNLLYEVAGRALTVGNVSGTTVTGNTAHNVASGWVFNSGTNTATLKNNVCYRKAGSVENLLTRISTITLTRSNNLYFAPDGGAMFNEGGVTKDTFAAYQAAANESGALGVDPLLTGGYRPADGSPLLGAGVHIAYSRDMNGVQRRNPPSIGAFDVATLVEVG
jgi:hypothetical protein